MPWWQLLAAIFGGSFFGSFLGPLLLAEWRDYRKHKTWVQPRQKLVLDLFREVSSPVISLRDISIRCGCSEVDARNLLVGMGAAGTTMSNGDEGWCFERARWNLTVTNIDED